MPEVPMVVESSEVGPSDDRPAGIRVVVSGEIDITSAPRLSEHISALIADGARLVVVDASDVQFLDSSGLRAIVAASNELQEVDGQLLIEGMSGAVKKTLEVAGLLERYRTGSSGD